MKNRPVTVAAVLVLAMLATAALGDDMDAWPVDPTVVRETASASLSAPSARGEEAVYSKLDVGSGLLVPGNDPNTYLSRDDYVSTLTAGTTGELVKLEFFGGIASGSAGTTLLFDFYDANEVYVSGFTVDLPSGQTGWYLWTLTLDVPVPIPAAGIIALGVGQDTSAGWFVSAAAPTIGSTGDTLPGIEDGGVPQNHKFALMVPEPASLSLLAGLALLLTRRAPATRACIHDGARRGR